VVSSLSSPVVATTMERHFDLALDTANSSIVVIHGLGLVVSFSIHGHTETNIARGGSEDSRRW
jgi:hypothetical protein